MNPFWKQLTYQGVPIVWDRPELLSALEAAFVACVEEPAKPDFILLSPKILAIDLVPRSRSHQRKVNRERRARCRVGIHAWSPYLDVCMGCHLTMIDHVEGETNGNVL